MSNDLPHGANDVATNNPDVWDAYSDLGLAVAESGPLDASERRLVKLALSIGIGSEGATHSHTRRALDEGFSAEALRQVALLAIPTAGFPAAVAGLTWIEDVLSEDDEEADEEEDDEADDDV